MKRVNIDFNRAIKNNKSFEKRAISTMKNSFENAKQEFLSEFEDHPITQEIEGGSSATNISNTLNGIGNLFSFIGFNRNDSPIQNLRNLIKNSFSLSNKKINGGIRFSVNYPSIERIKRNTPMPWEAGNSWVNGIERGISGFSNYMYKRFVEGRSGAALQTENKIRSSSYKRTNYVSGMINTFLKNIRDTK
jgi:hypothetical protein